MHMPQHPCCTDAEVEGQTAGLSEDFTAVLFLYNQDLAPFRTLRGLSAFRRACLSTPLYKNNPFVRKIEWHKSNSHF